MGMSFLDMVQYTIHTTVRGSPRQISLQVLEAEKGCTVESIMDVKIEILGAGPSPAN